MSKGVWGLLLLSFFLISCGKIAKLNSSNEPIPSIDTTTITGEITVDESDYLTINPDAEIADIQIAAKKRVKIRNGKVKLYFINNKGEEEDDKREARIINGKYTFKNLSPKKHYIVKYEAENRDRSKKIVQRAFVKPSAKTTVLNIRPESDLLERLLFEKLFKQVKHNGLSDRILRDFKSAAEEAIPRLLHANKMRYPSSIRNANDENPAFESFFARIFILLGQDKKFSKYFKIAKLHARYKKPNISLEEAKLLIFDIFDAVPPHDTEKLSGIFQPFSDFFVDQFARSYLEGRRLSVREFAIAFNDAIYPELGNLKENVWTVNYLNRQMLKAINQDWVKKCYDYYDRRIDDDSFENLPFNLRAIFHRTNRWPLPVGASIKMDIPQMLVLMKNIGLLDTPPEGSVPPELLSRLRGPAFDLVKFMESAKWFEPEPNEIYFIENRTAPVSFILVTQNTREEVVAIRSVVGLYADITDGTTINRVVLRYEDTAGNEQIFDYQKDPLGGFLGIAAPTANNIEAAKASYMDLAALQARMAPRLTAQANGRVINQIWMIWPYKGEYVIRDFKPGPAQIEVWGDAAGNRILAKLKIRLHKFDIGPVTILTPKPLNRERVVNLGWDPHFYPDEFTTQPIYVDWLRPTINTPIDRRKYKLAYDITVGRIAIRINAGLPPRPQEYYDYTSGGYFWKLIWGSWFRKDFVTRTYHEIHRTLPQHVQDVGNNYETRIEVDIRPMIVDRKTDEILYVGPYNITWFRIGETEPWETQFSGEIHFPEDYFRFVTKRKGVPVSGNIKLMIYNKAHISFGGKYINHFLPKERHTITPNMHKGELMVRNLGTIDELEANGRVATFSFPVVKNTDNTYKRFNYYEMIMWYDRKDIPLTDNMIDTAMGSFKEGYSFKLRLNYLYNSSGLVISDRYTGSLRWNLVKKPRTDHHIIIHPLP